MARILAVDDEPAIRSLLERTLGKDGHDVRCAACADGARGASWSATTWCCST